MNLHLYKRKYVKFAKIPTEYGEALAAFLIIEVGGEVVFVSPPKIIRYESKDAPKLTGEVSSILLLSGHKSRPVFRKAVLSPYLDYFNVSNEQYSVYSPRPPTTA